MLIIMVKRAIIPAAGLGSRMGMKPNESKEMLLDSNGKPIIDYSLDLCRRYNIRPLIIVRKEKEDLINYLMQYERKHVIDWIVLDEQGKEWPDTILASSSAWGDKNVLILPDTRFTPEYTLLKMLMDLDKYDLSFGMHKVIDGNNWSLIEDGHIAEKPHTVLRTPADFEQSAWGTIAFKKDSGLLLFNQLSERHKWHKIHSSYSLHYLDEFKDITRTGKVEP